DLLKKKVDLINLRRVPTVLQKEVIAADRRIYHADEYAADEFEMLTLSYYQKLNEERAEIIEDALATGRFIV
ncbi:MAG: nucleotidyltransferase domain-containing protein, partial [Chloroflexota bacterium]|nr:nucleotidyltransferase domain-containing protein [Chloroflexota bacterium]